MSRHPFIVFGAFCALGLHLPAGAAEPASAAELKQIQEQIRQIRQEYEQKLNELEQRLQRAEAQAQAAEQRAQQAAVAPPPAAGSNSSTAFNPNLSLIFQSAYLNQAQNPDENRIAGFPSAPEPGFEHQGITLAETEADIYGNIDPYFYGMANLALSPEGGIDVEEAFLQTLTLPAGLTLKAGRFFSTVSYQNEQHQHAWDFYDAPLPLQAFLGTSATENHGEDGLQLRWLAPTEQFLEFGTEIGRGQDFPGEDREFNGIGTASLFVHLGGDVGVSNSYLIGLSGLQAQPRDRGYTDTDLSGQSVDNEFSGRSRLFIASLVWKYAPNGNPVYTNFKVQGEFIRRWERGDLLYDADGDSAGPSQAPFVSRQSGGYLQAIWQFIPRLRVGLRGDWLDSGHVDFGANDAFLDRSFGNPYGLSAMLDFSPTEFSRFRLQYSDDRSVPSRADNKVLLQYILSLGAHGAHSF